MLLNFHDSFHDYQLSANYDDAGIRAMYMSFC